jgi:hypothetical protein
MAYALMDWLHDRGTRVIVISGYDDLPGVVGEVRRHPAQTVRCDNSADNSAADDGTGADTLKGSAGCAPPRIQACSLRAQHLEKTLHNAVLRLSELVGMPFAEPAKDRDRRQLRFDCKPS